MNSFIFFIVVWSFSLNSQANPAYWTMNSQSMFPFLKKGEHFIVTTNQNDFQKGQVIAYKTEIEGEKMTKIARIVSTADECIKVHNQKIQLKNKLELYKYYDSQVSYAKQLPQSFQFCQWQEFREALPQTIYPILICMNSNIGKEKKILRESCQKKDEYYLLGDNRGFSADSRIHGKVHKKNIIGLVKKIK